ncbi:MAG: hypothetical protein J0H49_20935 [Acidobacteria bacterium]|nr:hypothetical protein [Acidobacteriota bacterium]
MRSSRLALIATVAFAAGGWSAHAVEVRTVSLSARVAEMAWDETRNVFLVAAGSEVLAVDPVAASAETRFSMESTVHHLAVSGDGRYLYAAMNDRGVVRRYRIADGGLDLEIPLGYTPMGPARASALAVLPGEPGAVLISFEERRRNMAVFDGTQSRAKTEPLTAESIEVRRPGGTIYGWAKGQIYRFTVDAAGVSATKLRPGLFVGEQSRLPAWNGRLVTSSTGQVMDLGGGALVGAMPVPQGTNLAVPLATDAAGQIVAVAHSSQAGFELVGYSVSTFRPVRSEPLTNDQAQRMGLVNPARVCVWGTDGIAIVNNSASPGTVLSFVRIGEWTPTVSGEWPKPVGDSRGGLRLAVAANDLVYDARRNRIWASVPGSVLGLGNSLLSIDPASGEIVDRLDAGSEPDRLALTGDGSRIFVTLSGAMAVAEIDLETRQRVHTLQPPAGEPMKPQSVVALEGSSGSAAVSWSHAVVPYGIAIAVYDEGVARSESYSNFKPDDLIASLAATPHLTHIYPGDRPDALFAIDEEMHSASGHLVARMGLDEKGISLDRTLGWAGLQAPSYRTSLAYSAGVLWTGGGELFNSDMTRLLGRVAIHQSYATSAVPVPRPGRDEILFVYSAGLENRTAATVFDRSTLIPRRSEDLLPAYLMKLPAVVFAGPDILALAFADRIELKAPDGLPAYPAPATGVTPVGQGVRRLGVKVTGVRAVPGTSKLLVTIPSTSGPNGNRVALVNPETGAIEKSAFAGSEPAMPRTSADGSFGYVYLDGERQVARFDIRSGEIDLKFVPDPTGGNTQYTARDMELGPDGGLTLSYDGAWLATFDSGVLRRMVDRNAEGVGVGNTQAYSIALNEDGTIVYANDDYWSTAEFKRLAARPDGLQYLSGTKNLIGRGMISAGGLLYSSSGMVVDPEKSRVVGRLAMPSYDCSIAPDPAAERVYSLCGQSLDAYDGRSFSLIGSLRMTAAPAGSELIRFGADGLAYVGGDGLVYVTQTSAIPALNQPVSVPQPQPPFTSGVTVVDLEAQGLDYDSGRGWLYAALPNSEAANGDHIVALTPEDGTEVRRWPTDHNPVMMALSAEPGPVYFVAGTEQRLFYSGYSPIPGRIFPLDRESGIVGPAFSGAAPHEGISWSPLGLAIPPGSMGAVAVLESRSYSVQGALVLDSPFLRIYQDGITLPDWLWPYSFSCSRFVAGAPGRMYCSDGSTLTRLTVTDRGVRLAGSIRLLPGIGPLTDLVYRDGFVYTSTGLVIDGEAGTLRRMDTHGPVAVDDGLVYWAEPATNSLTVTLKSFDRATLAPVKSKTVNVSSTQVRRIVACGGGRVAFAAGQEIYIVHP